MWSYLFQQTSYSTVSIAHFVDFKGKEWSVLLKPDDTLDTLKNRIQHQTGISTGVQKLIANEVSSNVAKMNPTLRQQWFSQEKIIQNKKSIRYFILKDISSL